MAYIQSDFQIRIRNIIKTNTRTNAKAKYQNNNIIKNKGNKRLRYQKKNINKSKKKNPQREVDKYRERRLRYIDRTIQRKRERDRENAEREREKRVE